MNTGFSIVQDENPSLKPFHNVREEWRSQQMYR